jgi:hypothetical protein
MDTSGTLNPNDWDAGSVLIRPVRGKPTSSDPKGKDLLLVAPIILEHLQTSRLPLNLAPSAPVCVDDERPKQDPKKLPDGLPKVRAQRRNSQIVGLYDGGGSFFCGVYHSSGECLMRAPKGKSFGTYNLCPVCQYIVVDKVDPTKHPELEKVIDADYKKRYSAS